jgi:hypothetical protein
MMSGIEDKMPILCAESDGWILLAVPDDRDFLRICDVRKAALEQVNHFYVVARQAVPNEDRAVRLSQETLRFVPNL